MFERLSGLVRVSSSRLVRSEISSSFSTRTKRNWNSGRIGAGAAVGITLMAVVLIVLAVVLAMNQGMLSFSFMGTQHTQTIANQTVSANGNSLEWQATLTDAIAGTSVAGSIASYVLQSSPASCVPSSYPNAYCPSGESSTVTSGAWGPTKSPYSPGTLLLEATATGYYPIFILDENPSTVACTSCNQQNTYYYNEKIQMLQAPSSGTSATTDVAAVIGGTGGNAAPSSLSTSSFSSFSAVLNVEQASRAIATDFPVYGTTSQSVQGSSGQSYSEVITPQLTAIVCMNQTSVQLQSGSNALNTMGGSGINTGDSCSYGTYNSNIIGNSATSSTDPASAAITFSLEGTVGSSGHTAITVIWADNQLAAMWIASHFTTPAPGSFPSSGAAAGLPTGFSGLTPSNYGAPAELVEQSYTLIVSGH